MIELRGLVAMSGLSAIDDRLRAGEVVRLDGDASAVAAVLDVLAGRREPHAGEIVRDDARLFRIACAPVCLVRDGEHLPSNVEPAAAIALWAAFAAAPPMRRVADASHAAARGRSVAHTIWLADRALDEVSERTVQAAADDVRAGVGLMVWANEPGRERSDRVIAVATSPNVMPRSASHRRRSRPPIASRPIARAISRFAVATATSRAAFAMSAVAAVWLAACALTVAAHEGFWFGVGSAVSLDQLARLSAIGVGIACATATAARCASERTWPAMLRETGANLTQRSAALVAADLAGAALAATVAALPAIWMGCGPTQVAGAASGAAVAIGVTLIAAAAAGIVARLGAPTLGALAGAGLAIALRW